jgi:capsular exopolysaccharide synthesis family protein
MNDTSEVKLHFLDYWRVIKMRLGLIMLAFFLVMVTAGVTTYFLPREYFSKVSMEVKPDDSGPVRVFSGGSRVTYDPQFVATQFQILQKTEILYPVIDRLNLELELSPPGMKLPKQAIYAKLRRMMSLQEARNTGLIEIGVYHTDPQLAANIANTIAVIYQEARQTDTAKGVNRGLQQLEEEVDKQRKLVAELSRNAARIRAEKGINDIDPENFTSNPGKEDRRMIASEANVNAQRKTVAELRVNLEQIEGLKPEELMEALRTLGIEEPVVSRALAELQLATVQETRLLNSGLGENHPKIQSLRAERETHQKTLSDQLESIRRSQAVRLRAAESTLASLEKDLDTSEADQLKESADMEAYVTAKSDYIQARRILDNAELTLKTKRIETGINPDVAKIWERAEPSFSAARPNVPAYMALAAVVGVVVGVGLAFFIEYLDTSVKTLDDVERHLKVPVLAVIPKDITILMKSQAEVADAEAYRILRAKIEFSKPNRDANTFTLISGGPGEGKSTTLNNLAYTCAKGGYNVLVVDADLRRPSQHHFFECDNSFGLTDYLHGKADIEEITLTTKVDNLSFIPAGQIVGGDVGILNSQRMTDLMQRVKGQYDLVFFDSPPILGVSDGAVLTSQVDMTIMVVQHRRFPRAMLLRVKQAVAEVGGTLIGVVLNNVDARHDDSYGYYNTYADYYAPQRGGERRKAAKASRQAAVAAPANGPAAPAAATARPRRVVTDGEDY